MKYVNEQPEDTVASYLTKYFEGVSQTALAASVKRYKNIDAWSTELTMSEDGFNRLQDIIENAGELSRRAQMLELVDNSYAQKVYKEVYNK